MEALAKHASKEGVGAYQAKFLIKGLSLYKVFQRPFFALGVRMVFGLQPSHLVFLDEVAAKTNNAFNFPDKLKALTPWAVGKRSCPFFWSWSCLTRSPAQALN
jgi:hypothetical protein